jgi:glucosyl-dolichyl phosphate glucuronosyltransferase
MRITIILCTYNRCQSLAKTLESAAALTLPDADEWEVLVVDNNSSDQTRAVVEDFRRRYPGRFQYRFEPQQGKSCALNTGIREARGDVLAFVDDDVTFEPIWLKNLTSSLCNTGYAGVGGRTLLDPSFSPPLWLSLKEPCNLGGVLAQFDLGDRPRELDRAPYGANMAFRKEMFRRHGGFRTDLGPCPGSQIRGEDTDFGGRLLAAGERLLYEPSATVYHPIPKDRVRKGYFLSWYFDHGRAMARGWAHGADIFGIPRRCFTFFKLIGTRLPGGALLWVLTPNPQRRFFRKCWVWVTGGQIAEIYLQWRRAELRSQRGENIERERNNHSVHV